MYLCCALQSGIKSDCILKMSTLDCSFRSLKLHKAKTQWITLIYILYIYIYLFMDFLCYIANVDIEGWVQKLCNLWP
jgi:hypothetical protein